MLKEISVSNFKSINSELLFSMEADIERVSEYPHHILNIGGNNLLKVTSMYGPNGGGKTNILSALTTAKSLFLSSENSSILPQEICCVFNGSDVVDEILFFINNKYEIGYQFKIIPVLSERNNMNPFNGLTQKVFFVQYEIVEESVTYRKINEDEFKVLFTRNEYGEVYSDQFNELGILENLKLSKNKTVINYIFDTFANVNSNLQECLDVIRSLALELLSINDLNLNNIQIDEKILGLISINKNKLISLLSDVDINIKNIKIYKKDNYYPIFFVREIKCGDKYIEKEISLSQESAGTQKIFWIFVNVLKSFDHYNIFICDDMNALFHPKLFKAVIELFTSKDNTTSQLIFNSHDIINMDSEVFRRDEIWFIYRDENYSTKAVPLSNVVNYKGEQVRKDAKYSKQYLEGKYGADPFIKKGLSWK